MNITAKSKWPGRARVKAMCIEMKMVGGVLWAVTDASAYADKYLKYSTQDKKRQWSSFRY